MGKMKYYYTAYCESDEERIKLITEDILSEYPNLGDTAKVAAKMETPFGSVHEDYDAFSDQENRMNRLIDLIILTEDKPEFRAEYQKACSSFLKNFESWQSCFTYANPQEQTAYLVGQRYLAHQSDKSIPLVTFKEATELLQAPKRGI